MNIDIRSTKKKTFSVCERKPNTRMKYQKRRKQIKISFSVRRKPKNYSISNFFVVVVVVLFNHQNWKKVCMWLCVRQNTGKFIEKLFIRGWEKRRKIRYRFFHSRFFSPSPSLHLFLSLFFPACLLPFSRSIMLNEVKSNN